MLTVISAEIIHLMVSDCALACFTVWNILRTFQVTIFKCFDGFWQLFLLQGFRWLTIWEALLASLVGPLFLIAWSLCDFIWFIAILIVLRDLNVVISRCLLCPHAVELLSSFIHHLEGFLILRTRRCPYYYLLLHPNICSSERINYSVDRASSVILQRAAYEGKVTLTVFSLWTTRNVVL